jgi:hypothetical protein
VKTTGWVKGSARRAVARSGKLRSCEHIQDGVRLIYESAHGEQLRLELLAADLELVIQDATYGQSMREALPKGSR